MEVSEEELVGFSFWSVSGRPSCAPGAKCVILDTSTSIGTVVNHMKGALRDQRGVLVSPDEFRNTPVAGLVCGRHLQCVMLLNEVGEQVLVKKLLALQKKPVSN